MKAFSPDLKIVEIPHPTPHQDEVLVHVHAFGVNHADLLQRKGKYPPPHGAPEILGLEVSGTVEQLGTSTHQFKIGDRVMCLLSGGGYAEKVCVKEDHCMPIPHNLSFEEATAIPETFLTAYQALFVIGELQPQQWILIHAAGSGVGTAAMQLARQLDAKIIATSRSKDKLEACLTMGASAVIDTTLKTFSHTIQEVTEGHGVDLILDFIGAPYFQENTRALAIGGCIIFIATMGGSQLEEFDLRFLMKKWATLTGTTLRNRPDSYKTKLIKEFSQFALSRLERGILKPVIDTILPWDQAEKAHKLLLKNQAFGKIVLSFYNA